MTLYIHVHSLRSPKGVLIQDLQIDIPAGAVHTLMGPSGSGKSSLLAAVAGILPESLDFDGPLVLNGHSLNGLPAQARRVGILFQDDLLFAHMNVRENLLFAVPAGPKAQREAAVQRLLNDVEMGPYLLADPARLSGGQRSRIALARALLAEPQALLLDEPFSRLDAALRARMRELVFGLVASRRIAALLVTHDAADVADPKRLSVLSEPRTA
jgi:putative thiamine transport system ATP-binding protein